MHISFNFDIYIYASPQKSLVINLSFDKQGIK